MKIFNILAILLIVVNISIGQTLSDIYETQPNIDNCQPGVLKQSEKDKVLYLVNTIRAIHGLSEVYYDETGDEESQAATTLCVANGTITHTPTPDMSCYSQIAYDGCASSNLHMSMSSGSGLSSSESSIVGWMLDNHSLNAQDRVGHRRAIINPFLTRFAFGRADGKDGNWNVNSMSFKWGGYLDGNMNDMEIDYVAYPYHTYKSEWVDKSFYLSFSAFSNFNSWWDNKNVDYSSATITMTTESGAPVTVSDKRYDDEGWGGTVTCMVWKASNLQDEVKYNVEIKNIRVNGQSKNYSYWFKLTDDIIIDDFKAPTLIYPENNAENIALNISLQWEEIESADNYELIIEKKDGITGDITEEYNETGIKENTFDVELDGAATYFWKVRAVRGAETSKWSSENIFKTEGKILSAPILRYPIENARYVDKNTYFEWEDVDGAEFYRFSIYYNMSGSRIYILENISIMSAKVEMTEDYLEEDIFYTWEVTPVADNINGESSTRKFILISGGNNQPELLLPEDDAVTTNEVDFEWGSISGAENYEHQLFLNSNMSDALLAGTSDATSTRITGIEINQEYSWRVRAYFGNSSGDHEYGLWTDFFNFTVDKEGNVLLISEESNVSIYPNPSKDILNINSDEVYSNIEIYSINGIKQISVGNINTIDLKNLLPGPYIIKIETSTKTYLGKFIKE